MFPWDNFTQRQEVPSCEIAFITLTHFSCTKEGRKREREGVKNSTHTTQSDYAVYAKHVGTEGKNWKWCT